MQILIRRAAPGDEAALALVGQATFLETYAGLVSGADMLAHAAGPNSPAHYADWLVAPRTALWLAEVEPAAPVGFAALRPPDLPVETGETDLELRRIYLLSRFHGGGAGARLMHVALEHARAEGAARVLLGANAKNARALAFYAKHGFVQIGTRRFQVGATLHDDVVLAHDLQRR